MYSVKDDLVVDPFLGTGTTMAAAAVSCRNSMGYERDTSMAPLVKKTMESCMDMAVRIISKRLAAHVNFMKDLAVQGKPVKYENIPYGFPVVTNQERHVLFSTVVKLTREAKSKWTVKYDDLS